MADIATAYVQLEPSFRGGKDAIARELGGTEAGRTAGREVGAGLVPAVASAGRTAGARFNEQLAPAAGAAGRTGGVRAGEGLRAGILGGVRGLGARLSGTLGTAGHEAGEVAGAEAGHGFGERFAETAKAVVGPILAFFAAEQLVEFAKSSVEAGEDQERIGNLIEAQIRATGGAAHVSAEQVGNLAQTISDKIGDARVDVLSAEQALLKFSNVANESGKGNDIFTRASTDAADLAAVMHSDLPTAAGVLGKALNNPTAGLSRLTAKGIAFTKQQSDQITTLAQSGHLLQAQGIILSAFEHNYAGAAAAATTPLDRLKGAVSNLKGTFGQALLPVLDAAIEKLADLGTTAADKAQAGLTRVGDGFDALLKHNDTDLAKALGVGAGSAVVAGLDTLRDLVQQTVTDVVADFRALGPGVQGAAKGFGVLAVELGGELLAGVDAVAKALHPLFEALSATLGFLGSHANVFRGPAAGLLALALGIKAVKLAAAGFSAISNIGPRITRALAPARASMDYLAQSGSRLGGAIGRVGSAALSPVGLGAIGIVTIAAGFAIDALIKHYQEGKAQVQAFTNAIVADNDTIGAGTKATAVQLLQQQGAYTAGAKLGLSAKTLTDAALGQAPALALVASAQRDVQDAFNKSRAGQSQYNSTQQETTKGLYTLVVAGDSVEHSVGRISAKLGTGKVAADQLAAGYEAVGLNADGSAKSTDGLTTSTEDAGAAAKGAAISTGELTGVQRESALAAALLKPKQDALVDATRKLKTATAGLNDELQNMETNYFAIGDAKDAFQSALNASVQAFSDSKTGAIGTTDEAIAARASIEGMVDATDKLITADNNHHYSAGRIKADYDGQHQALVKFVEAQEKAGKLTKEQGDYYLTAQAHIPGAIGTVGKAQIAEAKAHTDRDLQQKDNHLMWYAEVHTPGAQLAAAKVKLVTDRLKAMPKNVNVAFYAQGTKNMLLEIGGVRKAIDQTPKSVRIRLALDSAAYEKKLLALEKAGASPIFAAQGLKNQATMLHRATGGPVFGPGTSTSDSVPAMLSTGEDVVNARGYSAHRALVDAINSGRPLPVTVGASASGSAAVTIHTHLHLDGKQIAEFVDSRVDLSHDQLATYLRTHGGG